MKSLEKYTTLASKLDARLQESRDHLAQLQAKATNLNTGLMASQRRHSDGDCSIQDLLRVRKSLEAILDEISQVESVIEQAESMNRQQLADMLPKLEAELGKEMAGVDEKAQAVALELKELRVKTLLTMLKLFGIVGESNNLHGDVTAIFNTHGVKLHVFPASVNLPLFVHGIYGVDVPLVVNEHELRQAFVGNVPLFVRWYAESGELTDEGTARENLRKKGLLARG